MSEILHLLAGCLKRGEAVVLATIVKASGSVPRRAGSKMLIFADGRIAGTIGGGEMESRIVSIAPAVLAVGKPRVVPYSLVDAMRGDPGICGGEVEVYLEPYLPAATVWVIGCGHVGQAMVRQAKLLGYYVVAWDDREGLASAETLPQADLHLTGTIESAISAHPIHSNCYIVVLTRNIKVDRAVLPALTATEATYIGVMGSRRRWQGACNLLRQDGMGDETLSRLHAPIGLELGAETPAEIAVSIMAQIVAHSHNAKIKN